MITKLSDEAQNTTKKDGMEGAAASLLLIGNAHYIKPSMDQSVIAARTRMTTVPFLPRQKTGEGYQELLELVNE